MRAPRMFPALVVSFAAAGALLLSGCGSSSTATAPSPDASLSVASSDAPAPAASVPSASAEASGNRVVAKWTCARGEGTEVTCTCEGSEADCKSTVAKPSTLKGMTGIVKFFNTSKGYGFVSNEVDGRDYFVHITAVERAGLSTLEPNQKVSFELERDRLGKHSAVNIQVVTD